MSNSFNNKYFQFYFIETYSFSYSPSLESSSILPESFLYSYHEQEEEVLIPEDIQNILFEPSQCSFKRDIQSNVKPFTVQMCHCTQSDKYTISDEKLFEDGLSSAIPPVTPELHTDPEVQSDDLKYHPKKVACSIEEIPYAKQDRNKELTIETNNIQDNNSIGTDSISTTIELDYTVTSESSSDKCTCFTLQNEVVVSPTLNDQTLSTFE